MRRRFKFIVKLALTFLVVGVPLITQAACSADGYTVVFINGIQTSETDASKEEDKLKNALGSTFNNQSLVTFLGYNETHGLDEDAAETTLPQLAQHDIDTILMKMHDQVQTRKLLIVGYSQGAMYANRVYDYLIKHGEPADSVGIYGVATPETILQNKGSYLNYEGDTVIYNPTLQVGAVVPPPPNIFVKDWWNYSSAKGDNVGHDFITAYLDNFADRMIPEIQAEMFTLRTTNASDTGACFEAPADTLGHKTSGVVLAAAKPASVVVNTVASIGWGGLIGSVAFLSDTTTAIENFFFHKQASGAAINDRATNDAIFGAVKAIYGSSLTPKQVDQLQKGENPGLGAAAILALTPDEPAPQGEVLGSTTEATDTVPVATSTVPFPTAPVAMPGEVVHYNAPTFGGAAQVDDNSSSSPPTPPPATLSAPTVTFSNWTVSAEINFCNITPRFVDIGWSTSGATSYDVYTQDVASQAVNLFETTPDTGTLSFPVPVTINSMVPTNLIVVAHDTSGDAATTTVRIDQALADQTAPGLLDGSLSPAIFATGISTTTTISIPFSEPLALGTIINDAFILSRIGDAIRTDTNATLSADGTTVTVTPAQPLQYSSRYNISIACTVSDIYGNRLPSAIGLILDPSSQYFTTEDAPTP